MIHLLIDDVLCQDLLDHAEDLWITQVLSLDPRGCQELVKLALVGFAPRALDEHIHVNVLGEVDLRILNLLHSLRSDSLQALPLDLVSLQLLMQLSQVHVEDGAVRGALVEVEAEVFARFEARDGRELARQLLKFDVQGNLGLEHHVAKLTSLIFLPHANHNNWRSDVFELDERGSALYERVNPPFIARIRDEERDAGEGAIAQVLFFLKFEEVLLKQAELLLDLLNWMFESSLQLSAQFPDYVYQRYRYVSLKCKQAHLRVWDSEAVRFEKSKPYVTFFSNSLPGKFSLTTRVLPPDVSV